MHAAWSIPLILLDETDNLNVPKLQPQLPSAVLPKQGIVNLGGKGVVLVGSGRLSWSRLRPLSMSARPRRIAIARVGDS